MNKSARSAPKGKVMRPMGPNDKNAGKTAASRVRGYARSTKQVIKANNKHFISPQHS